MDSRSESCPIAIRSIPAASEVPATPAYQMCSVLSVARKCKRCVDLPRRRFNARHRSHQLVADGCAQATASIVIVSGCPLMPSSYRDRHQISSTRINNTDSVFDWLEPRRVTRPANLLRSLRSSDARSAVMMRDSPSARDTVIART